MVPSLYTHGLPSHCSVPSYQTLLTVACMSLAVVVNLLLLHHTFTLCHFHLHPRSTYHCYLPSHHDAATCLYTMMILFTFLPYQCGLPSYHAAVIYLHTIDVICHRYCMKQMSYAHHRCHMRITDVICASDVICSEYPTS